MYTSPPRPPIPQAAVPHRAGFPPEPTPPPAVQPLRTSPPRRPIGKLTLRGEAVMESPESPSRQHPPEVLIGAVRRAGEQFLASAATAEAPPGVDPFDPGSVEAYVRQVLQPLHQRAQQRREKGSGGTSVQSTTAPQSSMAGSASASACGAAPRVDGVPRVVALHVDKVATERNQAREKNAELQRRVEELEALQQRIKLQQNAWEENRPLAPLVDQARDLRLKAAREAQEAHNEEKLIREQLHALESELVGLRVYAIGAGSTSPAATSPGQVPLDPTHHREQSPVSLPVAVLPLSPSQGRTPLDPSICPSPQRPPRAMAASPIPSPLAGAPRSVAELRSNVREYIRIRGPIGRIEPPPEATAADLWRLVVALSEE
eukprot:Hpha_TRINITY_DN33603_c0_g1::TRINITY_DN33603_c0_g1_i1::g.43136::m.43136